MLTAVRGIVGDAAVGTTAVILVRLLTIAVAAAALLFAECAGDVERLAGLHVLFPCRAATE
jgi:hypothetical protein